MVRRRAIISMLLAAAACLQWPLQHWLSAPGPQWSVAAFSGLAIVGAAFLLSWAGEAAEIDVPQGLAVAALAIVAVLPEYAVDVYFAWRAGRQPSYTSLATANMTGANRLLIGIGWASVLAASWAANKRTEIRLGHGLSVELAALGAATAYAFFVPAKGSLSLVDFVAFSLIYCWYAAHLRGAEEELELEGPAAVLGALPPRSRRAAVAALFLFSAAMIYLAAEPFAEGLVATGKGLGLNQFFLVQWVAPLASEAPEFTVAILFAVRGRPATGLRVLVSSKVSQWTLLIGMLPAVYALSAGRLAPMPLDGLQRREILLTAAQSLFALALLLDRRFGWKEALALAALFVPQPFFTSAAARDVLSVVFLIGSLLAFFRNGGLASVRKVLRETRG